MSVGDDKREPEFDYGRFKAHFLWAHRAFVALAMFVCAGFTASASWALLAFIGASGVTGGGPSLPKLAVKAVLFSVLFVASVVWLRALYRGRPDFVEPRARRPIFSSSMPIAVLLATLALVALATTLRLSEYPHIEPDETHHLIVARNVAVHGVYGSGMPATGFRAFDDYDSVGPTVLLPVAAAIRAFGDPLHSGRVAMAVFYLALSTLVFIWVSKSSSPTAGAIAVLFLIAAPGSLYLARTLYGEAPALAYLIAALLVWERALDTRNPLFMCICAGALFGCALLTKYFLVVAAWPALGMWVYDRMTYRRIRVVHAIVPAAVALGVLASWVAVTSAYGPHGGETAGGHVSMYRHNLLFGLTSVDAALAWLGQHWVATLVYLILGTYSLATTAMLASYRPACVFLLMFAILIAYWWMFFTTGAIPRYLWYALAIGAAFAGAFCASGLRKIGEVPAKPRTLGAAFSLAVAMLIVWETSPRFIAMATRDEMREERDAVQYLSTHYEGAAVATTFYPIERVANLLGGFPMQRVRAGDSWSDYDAVVVDKTSQADAIGDKPISHSFGRYAIVEPESAPQ